MTQKDAVFGAVRNVLVGSGVAFVVGSTNVAKFLNKELRARINSILIDQFVNNEIELSDEAKSKLTVMSELRSYVSGLVSNWIRKDTRLNGGSNTVTKSPNQDPQLKALKQLYKAQTDQSKKVEIQAFIDKRIGELT